MAFVSSGDADFAGSSGSFTFVVSTIPTATSLTATPNPIAFGSPLTLTATVSHSAGPGTYLADRYGHHFETGATVLGTVGGLHRWDPAGSAQASLITSSLVVRTHPITALYSGSANFGNSASSTVTVTVGKEATKVVAQPAVVTYSLGNLLTPNGIVSLGPLVATLTTASGTPIAGQTLTFTAKASPGGPVVCTAVTNSKGVASSANSKPARALEVRADGRLYGDLRRQCLVPGL